MACRAGGTPRGILPGVQAAGLFMACVSLIAGLNAPAPNPAVPSAVVPNAASPNAVVPNEAAPNAAAPNAEALHAEALHAGAVKLKAAEPAGAVEIRLKPYQGPSYLGPLKTVSVQIGAQSLPFLFDTGGGATVITPAVAKSVGCEPYGLLTGFRWTGERIDLKSCGPLALKLDSVAVEDEITVFDVMSLLGDPNAPVVGGIVSLSTLRGHAITLDLAHDRLVIETESSLAERVKTMSPMLVRSGREAGGATLDLFVAVKARKGLIWLELDSGNVGPVVLAPQARERLGATMEAENPSQVRLDFVGLGPVELTARQADGIYDGLLNADVLWKMVLTIDLRAERMWGALVAPTPARSGAPR